MADSNVTAASRDESQLREARRQRILQNSEKRMQKIMGLTKPETQESPNVKDENISPESKNEMPLQASVHPPETQKPDEPETIPVETEVRQRFIPTVKTIQAPATQQDANIIQDKDVNEIAHQGKTASESGQMQLLILVALALLTTTLLLSNYAFLIMNNALVVFVLWELYSLRASNAADAELSGLVRAAFMLSGLPSSTLQSFTKKIALMQKIFEDLCVYAFCILLFYQVSQMIY